MYGDRVMFIRGRLLEEKRESIIMACLTGGQHIDAAIEAADRLVPQADIEAAREEDRKAGEAWLKSREEANRIIDTLEMPKKINPWYSSVLARWWPF